MSAHREGCDSVFGCACDPTAPREPAAGATPAREETLALTPDRQTLIDFVLTDIDALLANRHLDPTTRHRAEGAEKVIRWLLAALRERDAARETWDGTLCRDTGAWAVRGACPVHGGDACLVNVPALIGEARSNTTVIAEYRDALRAARAAAAEGRAP